MTNDEKAWGKELADYKMAIGLEHDAVLEPSFVKGFRAGFARFDASRDDEVEALRSSLEIMTEYVEQDVDAVWDRKMYYHETMRSDTITASAYRGQLSILRPLINKARALLDKEKPNE